MDTVKKFTYIGMIIGGYLGWNWAGWFNFDNSYFTKIALGLIFAFFGIIIGYQLYKFFKRKF